MRKLSRALVNVGWSAFIATMALIAWLVLIAWLASCGGPTHPDHHCRDHGRHHHHDCGHRR